MSRIGVHAVIGMVMAMAPHLARGQRSSPSIGELDHAVWIARDGAPSPVASFAQSADGALWIGARTGLYRFDGMRFEPFEPSAWPPLPSLAINALLALPDSTLWIGYTVGGVSVLARGRVTSYGERDGLPAGTINALARDSTGDLWAATTTGLARLRGGRWQRMGMENGYPGGMTPDLVVDRRGTLWAPTNVGVFVLPRGASQFVRQAPSLDSTGSGSGVPREAPDGSVWGASLTLGLTRLSDSAGRPTPSRPAAQGAWRGYALYVDRRATAWVVTDSGLLRVLLAPTTAGNPASDQRSRVERVPLTSGTSANAILEDREGNVWVGTAGGIERFRETKLTPVQFPELITGVSIAPAGEGAVLLGSYGRPLSLIGDRLIQRQGGPIDVTCAYRDFDGGLWFGGPAGLWHAPAGAALGMRFARVPLPDEPGIGDVQAIAKTLDGDLWVSIRGGRMKGVFRRRGGVWSLATLPSGFADQLAVTMVADSAGRIWLGYPGNRLVQAAGDSMRVYSGDDGLHVGMVSALLVRGRDLWIGGEQGLTILRGGRFHAIAATEALRGITGIVQTAGGDLWLNGATGVTHIGAGEVRHVLEDSSYRASGQRLDYHDGLDGHAAQVRPLPTAIQGTDGRIWFTTENHVAWIDPSNIKRNRLAPPVQIRMVSAAGRDYNAGGHVALPARTSQLQITYTALSFRMPDRVRFRYRLSGVDTAWVDASSRREAFYTNLGPGSYRFRVIAANEDAVWNEAGASIDFEIPPTFTQTKAFLALIAAVIVGAGCLLALWRQRQLARALRAQFEGQLAERARVARELHDTLLGDMASVAVQLKAASLRVASSGGDSSVIQVLSTLTGQVQHAMGEARRSVNAMRTSAGGLPPLHVQLSSAATRVFAETDIAVHVEPVGAPRHYAPNVESEVMSIVTEAMANARQHAGCRAVAVTFAYSPRDLRVRVRDDGRGFDASHRAPAGHWGLIGMRERATSIGAQLSVESSRGAGTEVVLVVPAGRPGRWRWWIALRRAAERRA